VPSQFKVNDTRSHVLPQDLTCRQGWEWPENEERKTASHRRGGEHDRERPHRSDHWVRVKRIRGAARQPGISDSRGAPGACSPRSATSPVEFEAELQTDRDRMHSTIAAIKCVRKTRAAALSAPQLFARPRTAQRQADIWSNQLRPMGARDSRDHDPRNKSARLPMAQVQVSYWKAQRRREYCVSRFAIPGA